MTGAGVPSRLLEPSGDTALVAALRTVFRLWPISRGRGPLLRLCEVLLGSGPVRFDLGDGALIEGHLRDWVVRWAFMRLHEDDEPFQRSLACVEQAVTVIDVGANIGVWSLLAARRNPAATIHAFEPVPGIAAQLQHHARLNHAHGIRVNVCAVAAENGTQPFFAVKEGNIGASSFYEPRGGVAVDVPVTTLDTYVASAGVGRVDMIKIDAEGSEFLVLEGARRLLAADDGPLIFFELNEELCAHCGVTGADVKSRLVELGYGIYRWDGAAFAPVPIEQRHRHEDLFAFKARHQAGKCLGGNERARIMDGA